MQQFDDATADVVVVLGSDVVLPDIPTPTYYDPGYNDYYDPGTDTGDDYIPEDTPTPEPVIETPTPEPPIETPTPDPEPTPGPVPTEIPADHGGGPPPGQ